MHFEAVKKSKKRSNYVIYSYFKVGVFTAAGVVGPDSS